METWKIFLGKIKDNWKSGVTVSLVAIPLSISLAVAGGASPTQGIITAIWAGAIAGLFGGSNYNIVGPTGALSGILATFAFIHGPEKFGLLAIVVGLIILLAWVFKFERYLIYIPASTIQGFTLGVAFIIAFNQFNFAFGLSGLKSHEKFVDNLLESFRNLDKASFSSVAVFGVFLVLMFLIEKIIKRFKSLPQLPPAVIVALLGMILGYLSVTKILPIAVQTLGMRYSDMSAKLFLPISFSVDLNRSFMVAAITVALVAILETMLSAKIADGMTKTKHDKRKEMFGLGLANLASGLAGGIPATAALARTALNVKSGANHKISAFISAIAVAIISLFLFSYFKFLPLPIIAAILVVVAFKMIEREHLKRMWEIDKKSFWVAMLVAAITIYEDPIIGILVGAAVSLVIFLDTLSKGQFDLVINDINNKIVDRLSGDSIEKLNEQSKTLVYSIKGHLTYVDGQAHISRFESGIDHCENVVLRLRELYFIDLDGLDAFDEIIMLLKKQNKRVFVTGTNILTLHLLRQSREFTQLEKEGKIFLHTSQALKELGLELNVARVYR